jgi:regulator of sigma D
MIPPFKNVVKIPLDWSRTEVGAYHIPLSENQVAVDGIYKHPNFTDFVYGIQVKGGSNAERPDVIKEWKFYSNIAETAVGSAKPKRMHISYVVQPRYVTAWNKSVSSWLDVKTIVNSYANHLGLTPKKASSMTVNETGWSNKISKLYADVTSQTLSTSPKPSKEEGKSFITPESISFIVENTTFQVLTHKLLIQNTTTAHNFLGYRASTSPLGTLDLVLRLDDGDDL